MAKILLNVELKTQAALKSIDDLKQSLELITKSLTSMTPNKDLTAQLNALARAYGSLTKSANAQLTADLQREKLEKSLAKLEADTAKAEAQRAQATSKVAIAAEKAAQEIEKTRAATEKANAEEAKAQIQGEKLTQQAIKTAEAQNQFANSTQDASEQTAMLGEKFGDIIAKVAKYGAAVLGLRAPLQLIKSAISDIGETLVKTEDKVIEIRRILENPDSAESIANRIYDLAYQYGQTFDNVSEIVANFARTGRDFNESIKATEAALLAMNVAELNSTQASEGLISILAQFKKEPDELVKVVDQLNKAADKNPVTTGKLLTALQRTGSAAANANLNLERTVGVITSLSEATNRSGQNLGTAVNSLIQYSTKAESLNLFAKLSESAKKAVDDYRVGAADILDVWSAVSDEINRLQNESLEKQNELFEMFNSEEVEELSSSLHDELGDIFEQIGGVYDIANTYRKNYFIALLANMDRVFKVEQEIADAEGYSQKENEQYMNTYTAKVNQLQSAWQKLANDEQGILGLKKTLVEIGIDIVKFVENSGGLVTTITEIATGVIGMVTVVKSAKIAEFLKSSWTSVKSLASAMLGLKTQTEGAAAAGSALQAAFGWIGVAVMGITALVGTINRHNTEQRKARDETIATWKEQKEQAEQIESLLGKLNELNRDSEEYRQTEDKLVDLLGDKKILLEDLTEGTEEYSKKVKELTEAEIEHQRFLQLQAKEAAGKNLRSVFSDYTTGFGSPWGKQGDFFDDYINGTKAVSGNWLLGYSATENIEDIYNVLSRVKNAYDEVTKQYEHLKVAGEEIPKDIKHNYEVLKAAWDEMGDEYETYKEFIDEELKLQQETTKAAEEHAEAASEAAEKAANAYHEWISLGAEPNGPKDIASQFDSLTKAAKQYVNDLETVHAAQKEYAENGKVSASTMEKLLSLGDAYRNAIFDETGKLDLNSEALQKLNKDRENFLEAHGYVVPALEEETEKIDENTEAINKELKAVDKKIKFATQYKNEIETVNKAQAEYTATGKLSAQTTHDLLSLDEKLVDLMRDENGQLDVNSERLAKVLKIRENYVVNQGMVIENTKEEIKLLDEEIDKLKDTISLRKSELTIYEKSDASMAVREAKMREIISDIGDEIAYLERTQEIVDGVGTKQEEINRLKAEQLDYEEKITSMYEKAAEEQQKLIEQQQKEAEQAAKAAEQAEKERLQAIKDAQNAQIAAFDAEVSYYNSEITLIQAQNGSIAEQIEYQERILDTLQRKIEYLEMLGGYETEINNLKTQQLGIEEKIAALKEEEILGPAKDEIELLESRLKVEQQIYGHEQQQIDILVRINSLYAAQIQYLIAIAADEAQINQLKYEQLQIQSQILALEQAQIELQKNAELGAIQGTLDALLQGIEIEEESLDLTETQIDLEKDRAEELKRVAEQEEAIAKAKLDYINSVIDAYMKAEESSDSLAAKQEAVQAARDKLAQARRDAVAKAMSAAYKEQQKAEKDSLDLQEKKLAVEKARQALYAAENDLTTRVYDEETGEWQRQQDARKVEDAKISFDKAVQSLNDFVEEQAWDEVIAAVTHGSMPTSQMNAILAKWAMENYGEGSPEFIAKIRMAYRESLGSVDEDDSVIGAEKSVENAVQALNDYLKSEAVKELKEYLSTGARDANEMKAILDKWMGLGEGGELFDWRDGLLDVVTEAIESNYYDDSAVRSSISSVETSVKDTTTAVKGTTTAVNNLGATFTREIQAAAKVSAAAVAEVLANYQENGNLDPRYLEWANEVFETLSEYEDREKYYTEKNARGLTQAEVDRFIEEMKSNSAAWSKADDAERQRLEDRNLFLGEQLGLHRDDKSGIWYDENGVRAYDEGGVLNGIGGIKATDRPEIVLDPDLTAKILKPTSESQFRAFTDAMRIMLGGMDRTPDSRPVFNGQKYSDSHNTSTVINGIPIPQRMAEQYTIAELCRVMPMVGRS